MDDADPIGCVRQAQTVGNPTITAWALAWLAEAQQAAGDVGALAASQQAGVLAESVGSWLPRSTADRVAARHYVATGELVAAARIVQSSLRAMRRRGSVYFVAMYVGQAVPVLIAAGIDDSATRLLGAFLQTPAAQYAGMQAPIDSWRTTLQTRTTPEEFDYLLAEGGQSPLEMIAALAEEELHKLYR